MLHFHHFHQGRLLTKKKQSPKLRRNDTPDNIVIRKTKDYRTILLYDFQRWRMLNSFWSNFDSQVGFSRLTFS